MMRNLSKAGDENYFHQLLVKYGPIVKVTILGELQTCSSTGKVLSLACKATTNPNCSGCSICRILKT